MNKKEADKLNALARSWIENAKEREREIERIASFLTVTPVSLGIIETLKTCGAQLQVTVRNMTKRTNKKGKQ